MSKAKRRARQSIRYEDLPDRFCAGCEKPISSLDTSGDYCSACITRIREGLLDRARRLLIYSADERALLFEAILHIESWTTEKVRELDKMVQEYEEAQGLKIDNDVTAGVQRTCPYCGETYHPKRKDSPTCGKEECKKARLTAKQRQYLADKALIEKPQVENIPSAKTSHLEEATMPPPAPETLDLTKTEIVIEVDGQTVHIPLIIQLDIRVKVNASRD